MSDRPASRAWRRFRRNPSARAGALLVALFCLLALLAPWLAPYGPNQRDGQFQPPSWRHWLGTDSNEYDVLTRVIYGARLSLVAGLVSISLAVVVGAPLGTAAGYFGGRTDALLMRAIDVALAFPSILIAFLVVTAMQPGWAPVVIAVALINVPLIARQVRATVLTTRELDYVTASRALGASHWHVMTRVLAPAVWNPLIVLATLGLGSAILEVAGLSFLGFGGDAADAEWGSLLNEAKNHLRTTLWPAVGPGVAISLTILGFNLLGDVLRDALDPRTSGER
ncbi:MAG: ABC transporter permease [Pirellulaceae bacterium]|nr:ABC transporter permease [Pirellulaceae bacterium]